MAKHVWSVLCRRALLDQSTNNVSLIDVVENLDFRPASSIEEGKQWYSVPFETALVTLVTRTTYSEPEETKLQVRIVAPNGQAHDQSIVSNVNLAEHPHHRNFVFLQNLLFWSSGTYRFIVSLQTENDEWKTVAEVPVDITQHQQTLAS